MLKNLSSAIFNRFFALCVVLLLYPLYNIAQDKATQDLKAQYLSSAQSKSYDKQYGEALDLLEKALSLDKNFLEAKTFKARILGFQKNYEAGINEAKEVLRLDRNYIPAYITLADLFYWDNRTEEALNTVNNGLYFAKSNLELLEKKADYEYKLGRYEDAAETTQTLLYYDPTNETGVNLKKLLKKEILKNNVGVIYNFDSYGNILGNANALSFYYTRDADRGPWTIRLNEAIRNNQVGFQIEGDWYPRISKKSYLFLNLGFSGSPLFPSTRAGIELFHNLGQGWEGSIGLRYLRFTQDIRPVLLTASLGKYWKNNWASIRTFISYDQGPDNTTAYILQYRRYFSSKDHWVGLLAAFGYIPELNGVTSTNNLDTQTAGNIQFFNTRRFGIMYQHVFNKKWWARFAIGVGQAENERPTGTFTTFPWGSIQINHKF